MTAKRVAKAAAKKAAAPVAKSYNPFLVAQEQFDRIADMLDLDQATRDLLRNPLREYHFSIPIRMDHGGIQIFRGFRVQHNDARGPCKGGIRFHPMETIDTDPGALHVDDVEVLRCGHTAGREQRRDHMRSAQSQLTRDRAALPRLGAANRPGCRPLLDVPAPDVMTNPQDMLWMLDEFEKIHGGKFPGFITGKPISIGGSKGRTEATGYMVVLTVREALKELNLKPENTTASIQGFGNVAQYCRRALPQDRRTW